MNIHMQASCRQKTTFCFVETAKLSHFASPPAMDDNFCGSAFSSAIGIIRVLDFSHSNRCVLVSRCLNLHFPDDMWCGASFHVLICHLYICFRECLLRSGPFLNSVACFLIVESWALCIFGTRVLYQICLCKYFLPICDWSSHSLDTLYFLPHLLLMIPLREKKKKHFICLHLLNTQSVPGPIVMMQWVGDFLSWLLEKWLMVSGRM